MFCARGEWICDFALILRATDWTGAWVLAYRRTTKEDMRMASSVKQDSGSGIGFSIFTGDLAGKDLLKATEIVHISANLTEQQRKMYNVLTYCAYPYLGKTETHRISVSELCHALGMKSRNTADLKKNFLALRRASVEFDIFGRAGVRQEEWRDCNLLSEAAIIENNICEYAYPPTLKNALRNPRLYARLKLDVQRRISGRNAHASWEFFVEILDSSKRNEATYVLEVSEYKRILGIGPNEYKEFKVFNRSVISQVVKELNANSDIRVSVQFGRCGRQVKYLHFHISRNQDAVSLESLDSLPGDILSDELAAPVIESLMRYGFKQRQAVDLVGRYGSGYVSETLSEFTKRYKSGGKKIESPAAYIVRLLEIDVRNQAPADPAIDGRGVVLRRHDGGRVDVEDVLKKEFNRQKRGKAEEIISSMSDGERGDVELAFAETLPSHVAKFYRSNGLEHKMVSALFVDYIVSSRLPGTEFSDFELFKNSRSA